jgi:hypothetical protein
VAASRSLGDPEIRVAVVEGRLKKLLALIDLVPPEPRTESVFRLVRSECIGFYCDMTWLREHSDFETSGVGSSSCSQSGDGREAPAKPGPVAAARAAKPVQPGRWRSQSGGDCQQLDRVPAPFLGSLENATVDSRSPFFGTPIGVGADSGYGDY